MAGSQVDLLAHDIDYLISILRSHPDVLARVIETPDPDEHAFLLVLGDQFFRACDLALGITSALTHDLELTTLVLGRALLEGVATLGYLLRHPSRFREATIFLAFTYIVEQQEYPDDAAVATERTAILARMPPEVIAEAERRSKIWPRTWHGLKVKEMAARSGVRGFDSLYRVFSGHTHSGRAGRYFRIRSLDDGHCQLDAGHGVPSLDRETHANWARRALHTSFKEVWAAFGGTPMPLNAEDPEAWLSSAKSSDGTA